jgi:uncharacterized protein (DUF4415 family)
MRKPMRPPVRPHARPPLRRSMRPLTDEEGEVRELTKGDLAGMRPIAEVDPGMLEAIEELRRKLGRPKSPSPEVHIGFGLAPHVVEGIRATGKGYNARVEAARARSSRRAGSRGTRRRNAHNIDWRRRQKEAARSRRSQGRVTCRQLAPVRRSPDRAATRRFAARSSAGDQPQPGGRMEGAHQQVHRDHAAQRRRMLCGRAEQLQLAAAKTTLKQRHDCEGRRGCERYPVGGARRGVRLFVFVAVHRKRAPEADSVLIVPEGRRHDRRGSAPGGS